MVSGLLEIWIYMRARACMYGINLGSGEIFGDLGVCVCIWYYNLVSLEIVGDLDVCARARVHVCMVLVRSLVIWMYVCMVLVRSLQRLLEIWMCLRLSVLKFRLVAAAAALVGFYIKFSISFFI